MFKKRMPVFLLTLLILVLIALSVSAKYPDRAITCVIAYPPGGGSDVLVQAVNPYLEKYLGVPIVNEYKGGASGAVGWTYFANNAKPDGYTICIVNFPSMVGNIIMYPEEVKYSLDSYIPLYNIVDDPGMIFTAADSKFDTAKELFEYAKKNPKQVTVAHSGVGSDDWVRLKMLEIEAGIEFIEVPFPGSGPAWQATMGGHVDVCTDNLSIVYQQILDGTLKPLSMMTPERSKWLPDVPTLKEDLGIDATLGSSRGYSLKAGTPEEIVKVLEEAFDKVLADPEFLEHMNNVGLPLLPLKGEEFKKYIDDQVKKFSEVYEASEQGQ